MSLAASAELNSELDELEQNVQASWDGLLQPYERIHDCLSKTWGAVSHLKVSREACLEFSRLDRLRKSRSVPHLLEFKPRTVPHLLEFSSSSQDGLELVT